MNIDFFTDLPPFDLIKNIFEMGVVGLAWIILLLFGVQAIQQVRLLNRFLHTSIAGVWTLLSFIFLVAVLLTGVWYILG